MSAPTVINAVTFMITKEQLEKIVKNNRAGIAAHQIYKLIEDSEKASIAYHSEQSKELVKDKERLDWLLDFITHNGTDGLLDPDEINWSVFHLDDPMLEPEVRLDRLAIDTAMKGTKAEVER
jgi:hypothetical protein